MIPDLSPARLKRLLRATIALAAGAAVGVSVLGLVGAALPALDLFNQLAPIWLAGALIGLALTPLAFGKSKSAIAVAAALSGATFIQAALIVPEVLTRRPPTDAPDGAPTLSVVSLNVWDQRAEGFEPTIDYLAASNADVIVLVEANGDFMEVAAPRLAPLYPYRAQCRTGRYCRIYIYSRHPLHPDATPAAFPPHIRAAAANFILRENGARFRVIGVHLARPRPAVVQLAQYAMVEDELARGARETTILAGDFNTAPWSFRLRRFDRVSGMTRATRALPTWPAARFTRLRLPPLFAFAPIDHVYVGENWRVLETRRGPSVGSDHYPVETRLVWAPR